MGPMHEPATRTSPRVLPSAVARAEVAICQADVLFGQAGLSALSIVPSSTVPLSSPGGVPSSVDVLACIPLMRGKGPADVEGSSSYVSDRPWISIDLAAMRPELPPPVSISGLPPQSVDTATNRVSFRRVRRNIPNDLPNDLTEEFPHASRNVHGSLHRTHRGRIASDADLDPRA